MKNNKKGFTLIELLSVIVILAIIALIAVPTIVNISNKAKQSAFKDTAYAIINAADLYYASQQLEFDELEEDKTFNLPGDANTTDGLQIKGKIPTGIVKITTDGKVSIAVQKGKYCAQKGFGETEVTVTKNTKNCIPLVSITAMTLTSSSELSLTVGETSKIGVNIEPSEATNKKLNYGLDKEGIITVSETGLITAVKAGTAKITVKTTDGSNISKTINVTVSDVVGETYTNGIMQSTNNCINEGTCPNGTLVTVSVNNQQTYDFYTIKDDGNNLTLIMDSNLGLTVAWINASDYATENNKDANPDECEYTSCYDEGPVTAVNYLNSLTDDEWSNIPKKDYVYSGLSLSGTRMYEDITRNMRARMITYKEAKDLCSTSCPSWLYMNLESNSPSGYGYWTSTASGRDAQREVWVVELYGLSAGGMANAGNRYGVRPVIELSK